MAQKPTADQPSMAGWKPPYGGGSVAAPKRNLTKAMNRVGGRIKKKMTPIKSSFKKPIVKQSVKKAGMGGTVKSNIA